MSKASRIRNLRKSNLSKDGVRKPKYFLILGVFLFTVGIAAIYAFKSRYVSPQLGSVNLAPKHTTTPKEPSLSGTEFGQFPPNTDAERELEKLLHGKDDEIDLALANWLIAADVPQFNDMPRETYFAQIDQMIAQVRHEMGEMEKVAESRGKSLSDPDVRCSIFCNAILKLGFAYTEEFRQENKTPDLLKAMYSDANNVLFAGLISTHRGSCVSMPLIYLVIGQRLGLPVHLVALGRHYFIRWEEKGYHMNIETTIVEKVSVTPDDSVYLDVEGMTREQVTGSDLRNLSNREVVGNLFFARSAYWVGKTTNIQTKTRQCFDLSRARYLSPDDPAIKAMYREFFDFYGIKPTDKSPNIKPRKKPI